MDRCFFRFEFELLNTSLEIDGHKPWTKLETGTTFLTKNTKIKFVLALKTGNLKLDMMRRFLVSFSLYLCFTTDTWNEKFYSEWQYCTHKFCKDKPIQFESKNVLPLDIFVRILVKNMNVEAPYFMNWHIVTKMLRTKKHTGKEAQNFQN